MLLENYKANRAGKTAGPQYCVLWMTVSGTGMSITEEKG